MEVQAVFRLEGRPHCRVEYGHPAGSVDDPRQRSVGQTEESGWQNEHWAEESSTEHTVCFERNIQSSAPARSLDKSVGMGVLVGHRGQFSQGAITALHHLPACGEQIASAP